MAVSPLRSKAFALNPMPWIVKNLWLIPALPILAAGLSVLAPKAGCDYTFAI